MRTILFLLLYTFISSAFGQNIQLVYSCQFEGFLDQSAVNFLPKECSISSNGEKMLISQRADNPMFASDQLVDKDNTYIINKFSKTYSVVPLTDNGNSDTPFEYKKIASGEKVAGYNCDKYSITYTDKEQSTTLFIWATKDINLPKFPDNKKMNSPTSLAFQHNSIEGTIVKMEMPSPMPNSNMDQKIIYTLKSFSTEKLDPSLFEIPSNFTKISIPTK